MPEYNISKIAGITGKSLIRDNVIIRLLLTDSRRLISPADTIFFALEGGIHDGHDYIKDLFTKGVRAFVISETYEITKELSDANYIRTGNTLEALQQLTRYHRKSFQNPVIAITGSNGKTIVKEWLFHCLSVDKNIARSPKSYNSQVGVPLSVWLLEQDNDLGIFEAGISQPGEMEKLQEIIQPTIGILTNIGEAHQENFISLEQKTDEKLKLFTNCDTLVYCQDHELINTRIENKKLPGQVKLFKWSFTGKADLQITNIGKESNRTLLTGIYRERSYNIEIPFTDKASIENAVHVWAALICLNTDQKLITSQMSSLPPVAMRLEIKQGINNCTLINDSYNSDINSLAIALDTLNMQSQHKEKSLILSDLLQTGRDKQELYKSIAELVKDKKIDRLIGIGNDIYTISGKFEISGYFYKNTGEFIERISDHSFRDEAILLKGSRQYEFEKISAILEQKTHLTRLEINLDALVHNLHYYRSLLEAKTRIMVMVKAFSYGSGSYEIANMLQFQRTDYLGVAFVDEGVSLRQAGITIPILVMSPELGSYDQIIKYQLEPEIYSFRSLELFDEAVRRNQEISYPVHIKIDTGMHRLGFLESEVYALCAGLTKSRNLKVISVFSNLAASDEPVHDDFSRIQIERFNRISDRIIKALGYSVLRHILNSSGIERFPDAQLDMVRLGIGLYGASSFNQAKLKNVSSLKSTISQIKKVPADETVGYGRMGNLNKEITIGIIPIGYADGLNRRLGNENGKFLIKNKFIPIIGNICMDMCMVDISGIDVKEGDEVILFGDDYPVSEVARQLDTIPYEILTGISGRVKRIYFHE
ncbi:MAG: bifunctional UDP-N-acetylmuramoyl-tripeptide:D-alanyl-D-alanine ligase/alanine racemase [Bacteroidales bacterium]|nr:MAG: bifunctional UDP-N-acetylmuramoyl-tripeptide:D-alanyl-D-alanine ligase/alanine racemase [Bacteroidales bacterium]